MTTMPAAQAKAKGTHINAIGADAPGKQELDPTLLMNAEVFVDDLSQATHSGEINVPVSTGRYDPARIAGTLGEVIIKEKFRSSPDAITIIRSREEKYRGGGPFPGTW